MNTTLITGPTGTLGRSAALAMAGRPTGQRPDLLLVGRPGDRLEALADEVRSAGATAYVIGCDMNSLADVRSAASQVHELLDSGAVPPLQSLIANAGISVTDTRGASADGYERTFAVNYLAHAQLIRDLLEVFAAPARIILVGSATYYANWVRRILHVPPADWRGPIEIATPAPADTKPSLKACGTAYSDSKLALIYYAHELQRRAPEGINVSVFEPGFMPGTGLGREHGRRAQRMGERLQRMPIRGIADPATSGPALASAALDQQWAHLRDGAFVLIDEEREVMPFANDREREARLWEATTEMLAR